MIQNNQELILVQIPKDIDRNQIKKLKTIDELENKLIRMSEQVQNNLKRRIYIYEKKQKSWKAQTKLKKIYKYVQKNKIRPKQQWNKPIKQKINTLKK